MFCIQHEVFQLHLFSLWKVKQAQLVVASFSILNCDNVTLNKKIATFWLTDALDTIMRSFYYISD